MERIRTPHPPPGGQARPTKRSLAIVLARRELATPQRDLRWLAYLVLTPLAGTSVTSESIRKSAPFANGRIRPSEPATAIATLSKAAEPELGGPCSSAPRSLKLGIALKQPAVTLATIAGSHGKSFGNADRTCARGTSTEKRMRSTTWAEILFSRATTATRGRGRNGHTPRRWLTERRDRAI